jgi:hypothetical protein
VKRAILFRFSFTTLTYTYYQFAHQAIGSRHGLRPGGEGSRKPLNTFNHAQFDGANSVDGNINDSTFGQILKSQPGRVSQAAVKLNF